MLTVRLAEESAFARSTARRCYLGLAAFGEAGGFEAGNGNGKGTSGPHAVICLTARRT